MENGIIGTRVRVYWNLHRKCWSVQHAGRVVAHARSVELAGVTFRVSAAGRARVLREGRKNVHAFACGELRALDASPGIDVGDAAAVSYNPRRGASFYRVADGADVARAARAFLGNRSVHCMGAE